MRPTQLRHRLTTPSLFVTCKCDIAIPVHQPLLRYALQQAALEPSVRAIHYQTGSDVECARISPHGIVLDRADGRFLLRVCEARPERSEENLSRLTCALERHGLRLLERDAADIRREPLFSNSRAVWSYARHHVSLTDRLRIALALEDGGPQSLIELEERARPACDILAAICALACEGLAELDLRDAPLGPVTIVRGR